MPPLFLTLGFNLTLGLVRASLTVTPQNKDACFIDLLVFSMIIWMKKANNFRIPKIQTQCCLAVALFFYQIQPDVSCKSDGCL